MILSCSHCKVQIKGAPHKRSGSNVYCCRTCAIQAGAIEKPERRQIDRGHRIGPVKKGSGRKRKKCDEWGAF